MSDVIDIEERRRNFSMRKYIFSGLLLLIVIFILFIIISNLFIVREGEYKVVRQFGEVVRVEDEPGLYFKIPFIQTVTSLPKHQLTYDVEEAEINTKDK
ncbi:MAG: SPFH domain-containing protein, partial [Caldibacillus sp.]